MRSQPHVTREEHFVAYIADAIRHFERRQRPDEEIPALRAHLLGYGAGLLGSSVNANTLLERHFDREMGL